MTTIWGLNGTHGDWPHQHWHHIEHFYPDGLYELQQRVTDVYILWAGEWVKLLWTEQHEDGYYKLYLGNGRCKLADNDRHIPIRVYTKEPREWGTSN